MSAKGLRDRIVARVATARPRRILVGAWLAAVLYGFPGYLSTDSVEQLYQARSGVYTDWHPPLMARAWHQLEHVVTGPLGMLLVQLALFTIGVHAILARRLAPGPAAAATAAIVLFPPVLTPMAVVWKDAPMAAFLIVGAALATSPRRRDLALAAGCLLVAAGLRHNAPLAIVPLAIAGARRHLGGRVRALVVGVAAAGAIAGLAFALDRAMTDADTHPWTRSVAMLDLAGTIREAGPLGDDELRAALAGVPIHAGHDLQAVARAAPNRQAWWYATDGDDRLFDPPTTPAERDAVADAWWRLVRAHPVAWLEHRARVFAVLVGLAPSRPAEPVRCSFLTLDEQRTYLHFDATPSPVQRGLAAIFDALGYTPLYRPIVYLAIAALLLVRRRRAHVALLASGVLYELGLFVAAPSTDYRYSHWMIVTVLIAAVAAAAETVPAWRRDMASS